MPQQPDLLDPQRLTVSPAEGLEGPRLWVRRLVIWREPGGEKVRDIELRPGLNIVWSPDGADDVALAGQTNAVGHGSGKTLFAGSSATVLAKTVSRRSLSVIGSAQHF